MRLMLSIFVTLGLVSCGGGGGGNSTSNAPDTPSTPIYTYNKITDAGAGSTFDEVTQAWLHQPGYYAWFYGGSDAPLDLSIDSELNSVARFSTGGFFESDDLFADVDWEVVDDSTPQPASNVLDNYAAWAEVNGTVVDLVNLTETAYRLEAYGFYLETGGVFLGTEYVFPMILFNDHGSDYAYGVGSSSDTLLKLEVMASVYGDKTNSGDMPTTGSHNYSSRAIATAHLGWYGGYYAAYNEREIEYLMGVESDSTLTVDHNAGTVSGSVSFDYVFRKGMFLGAEISGFSLGTIDFQGEITGRNVEGTATWSEHNENVEGSFQGSFYGPNGDEFGGVLRLDYSDNLPGVDLILASVVASK